MANQFKGTITLEEYAKREMEYRKKVARQIMKNEGWSYPRALGAALCGVDLGEKKHECR